MEAMVKKYQQKFRKVKEEMQRWEDLQSRLISQFSNASAIIQRLQVIGDKKHYGILRDVDGIEQAVLRKQLESLETIIFSINKTMEDFRGIVILLEKMVRDGRQIAKGGSQLSAKQLKRQVGVKPSLSDCLDGLVILHEMHNSEYLLKTSVVSALSKIALTPSVTDLGTLCQLLVDQPNIRMDEGMASLGKRFSLDNLVSWCAFVVSVFHVPNIRQEVNGVVPYIPGIDFSTVLSCTLLCTNGINRISMLENWHSFHAGMM